MENERWLWWISKTVFKLFPRFNRTIAHLSSRSLVRKWRTEYFSLIIRATELQISNHRHNTNVATMHYVPSKLIIVDCESDVWIIHCWRPTLESTFNAAMLRHACYKNGTPIDGTLSIFHYFKSIILTSFGENMSFSTMHAEWAWAFGLLHIQLTSR